MSFFKGGIRVSMDIPNADANLRAQGHDHLHQTILEPLL